MNSQYIAHVRESDKLEQTLGQHILNTAKLARGHAEKIGLGLFGELLGLLHDLGKYSEQFQQYIRSVTGLLDQDTDVTPADHPKKGEVDHSTAGAQLAWQRLLGRVEPASRIVAQIAALILSSHHSGLINVLLPSGFDNFGRRINTDDSKSHLRESIGKLDDTIRNRIDEILMEPRLIEDIRRQLLIIAENEQLSSKRIQEICEDREMESRIRLKSGLLLRFLFSCLIDADRTDTADFEKQKAALFRQRGQYVEWDSLVERLEKHIAELEVTNLVDVKRQEVSAACRQAAKRPRGVFTLTVPTGGGKTLSSLRFALHHADRNTKQASPKTNHVFYIVPYTSIIDQNADEVRDILETGYCEPDTVVLEHHSNLTGEKDTWRNKVLSENWDAPIVFTTSVQFLEAIFGSGTRSARRMHELANSVIIFDEIQTLPIRCIHLFCNAIHFLVDHCGCTVLLCTATQPMLGKVDRRKGALNLSDHNEIIPNVSDLYNALRRVDTFDYRKDGGWTDDEIAILALEEQRLAKSCLVIVNTTKSARNIFKKVLDKKERYLALYHLSANMCPAHRMLVLREIRTLLAAGQSVVCISTQVIEAGVNIDFGSVIRSVTGLDSIAQAAGRCNRHGKRLLGRVIILNPADENLDMLHDIQKGKETTERVLGEFPSNPALYGPDLLDPKTIRQYFEYYFFERQKEMAYPVKPDSEGIQRDDTLLEILSCNRQAVGDYRRIHKGKDTQYYFYQSFMTSAEAFKSIDAPTRGVVVPYGEAGKRLVADLFAKRDKSEFVKLLREAQKYSVNVYPHLVERLRKAGALNEPLEGTGVLCLDPQYYSPHFGISDEPVTELEFLCP